MKNYPHIAPLDVTISMDLVSLLRTLFGLGPVSDEYEAMIVPWLPVIQPQAWLIAGRKKLANGLM